MKTPIRVAAYGLGPIGRGVAAAAVAKESLELVGTVDIAPDLRGKSLGDLVPGASPELRVSGSLGELLSTCSPEVALHATGSYLEQVFTQFEDLLSSGISVVSTCEEAGFPLTDRAREMTTRLGALAKDHGARLLATGINPGFAMDIWPLVATAANTRVDRIVVRRVLDASKRREPLQRKVGAGLTETEFRSRVEAGTLGHVGLAASAAMLARGLGREVISQEGGTDPVMADSDIHTEYFDVSAGQVAGLSQELRCRLSGGMEMVLHLEMYLGAREPVDEVRVEGDHPLRLAVTGGFPGDTATAALVTNTVAPMLRCPPGFLTMLDLPLFGCSP